MKKLLKAKREWIIGDVSQTIGWVGESIAPLQNPLIDFPVLYHSS